MGEQTKYKRFEKLTLLIFKALTLGGVGIEALTTWLARQGDQQALTRTNRTLWLT